jgi:hypothetical protein
MEQSLPITPPLVKVIDLLPVSEVADNTPPFKKCCSRGFPGGIETHKEKLESEGHIVFAKGKRLFVKNREDPDGT